MSENYTHKEMVELCDDARKTIVSQVEELIEQLERRICSVLISVDDVKDGIAEIKSNNGI